MYYIDFMYPGLYGIQSYDDNTWGKCQIFADYCAIFAICGNCRSFSAIFPRSVSRFLDTNAKIVQVFANIRVDIMDKNAVLCIDT